MLDDLDDLDNVNYLAIKLIEYLGNDAPTQQQISLVEDLLAMCSEDKLEEVNKTLDDMLPSTTRPMEIGEPNFSPS